jgi:hypothetical protein
MAEGIGFGEVHVYAVGLCYLSACVRETVGVDEMEELINGKEPTGLDSKWRIAEEDFEDGTPNPAPCPDMADRKHWLLSC